jgi:hypothetical protein
MICRSDGAEHCDSANSVVWTTVVLQKAWQLRAQEEGANSRVKLDEAGARPSSIPFLTRFATSIASIPSLFPSIEPVSCVSLPQLFI